MTLSLDGSLDAATAPVLREQLLDLFAKGCRQVVVDLSGLFFLNSTGLGVLVGALKRYRSTNGELALQNPSRQVRQLLAMTGIDKVFGLPEA